MQPLRAFKTVKQFTLLLYASPALKHHIDSTHHLKHTQARTRKHVDSVCRCSQGLAWCHLKLQ